MPSSTNDLDFCRPFFTHVRGGTVNNYIGLFIHASTRTVHSEPVPFMAAPSLLTPDMYPDGETANCQSA